VRCEREAASGEQEDCVKHKTWFRLVMKAIGVLLIGLSLPMLAQHLGGFMRMYNTQGGLGTWAAPISIWEHLLWLLIGYVLQLAFGLYLLFGGRWLVNLCIPSNRPYCPECGYDLSHNKEAARCPECGVAVGQSQVSAPEDQRQ
jgi:hypothetical protein